MNDAAFSRDPARTNRAEKPHIKVERRLKLIGAKRREQGRADGVIEHGRKMATQHIPHRIGEIPPRFEREFNHTSIGVDVDELQAQCRGSRGIGVRP